MKKIVTMDKVYGDGSDHLACKKCGFCITCGDCKKFGCGSSISKKAKIKN